MDELEVPVESDATERPTRWPVAFCGTTLFVIVGLANAAYELIEEHYWEQAVHTRTLGGVLFISLSVLGVCLPVVLWWKRRGFRNLSLPMQWLIALGVPLSYLVLYFTFVTMAVLSRKLLLPRPGFYTVTVEYQPNETLIDIHGRGKSVGSAKHFGNTGDYGGTKGVQEFRAWWQQEFMFKHKPAGVSINGRARENDDGEVRIILDVVAAAPTKFKVKNLVGVSINGKPGHASEELLGKYKLVVTGCATEKRRMYESRNAPWKIISPETIDTPEKPTDLTWSHDSRNLWLQCADGLYQCDRRTRAVVKWDNSEKGDAEVLQDGIRTVPVKNDDGLALVQGDQVVQIRKADFAGYAGAPISLAADPTGKLIAAGFWDTTTVTVFDNAKLKPLHRLDGGHEHPVHYLAFSNDGQRLVSLCASQMTVWKLKDATAERTFPINPKKEGNIWQYERPVFNADGSRLIYRSRRFKNEAINIRTISTGEIEFSFGNRPKGFAVSPDCTLAALGEYVDGTRQIVLWNLSSQRAICKFRVQHFPIELRILSRWQVAGHPRFN